MLAPPPTPTPELVVDQYAEIREKIRSLLRSWEKSRECGGTELGLPARELHVRNQD